MSHGSTFCLLLPYIWFTLCVHSHTRQEMSPRHLPHLFFRFSRSLVTSNFHRSTPGYGKDDSLHHTLVIQNVLRLYSFGCQKCRRYHFEKLMLTTMSDDSDSDSADIECFRALPDDTWSHRVRGQRYPEDQKRAGDSLQGDQISAFHKCPTSYCGRVFFELYSTHVQSRYSIYDYKTNEERIEYPPNSTPNTRRV